MPNLSHDQPLPLLAWMLAWGFLIVVVVGIGTIAASIW